MKSHQQPHCCDCGAAVESVAVFRCPRCSGKQHAAEADRSRRSQALAARALDSWDAAQAARRRQLPETLWKLAEVLE
jgi:predicted RNA-binding Zn-ribbon protein involved in translation (DUF1610 family)